MVLVDTSVWVTHLREGSWSLEALLQDAQVVCHPFVLGELACGNTRNRKEILSLLQVLPMAPVVSLDEVLYFIERNDLIGSGVGFVDVHLLASTAVAELPIWTSDKRLRAAALKLDLSYT